MYEGRLLIASLIASVFLLNSCEKDDVSTSSGSGPSNYFLYDGQRYNLDKGFIENLGENFGDNENGYDVDVFLVSDSINYSIPDEDFVGVGDVIYLDLNTSSEDGLVDGVYKFSFDRDTFTLVDGEVGVKININTEEGEEVLEIAAGEVDVSILGKYTTLDFDLTTTTNKRVRGNFKKELTKI